MADRAVNVLHNRNMQSRYIEVFQSSESEAAQVCQPRGAPFGAFAQRRRTSGRSLRRAAPPQHRTARATSARRRPT